MTQLWSYTKSISLTLFELFETLDGVQRMIEFFIVAVVFFATHEVLGGFKAIIIVGYGTMRVLVSGKQCAIHFKGCAVFVRTHWANFRSIFTITWSDLIYA